MEDRGTEREDRVKERKGQKVGRRWWEEEWVRGLS